MRLTHIEHRNVREVVLPMTLPSGWGRVKRLCRILGEVMNTAGLLCLTDSLLEVDRPISARFAVHSDHGTRPSRSVLSEIVEWRSTGSLRRFSGGITHDGRLLTTARPSSKTVSRQFAGAPIPQAEQSTSGAATSNCREPRVAAGDAGDTNSGSGPTSRVQ